MSKKQYLLAVDEAGMALLTHLIPIHFIEVSGMGFPDNTEYVALVTPLESSEITSEARL